MTVSLQRQRQTAVVRVADTGIGIAPEHFDRPSLSASTGWTAPVRAKSAARAGTFHRQASGQPLQRRGQRGKQAWEGSTFTVRLPLWSRTQEE